MLLLVHKQRTPMFTLNQTATHNRTQKPVKVIGFDGGLIYVVFTNPADHEYCTYCEASELAA